MKIYLLLTSCLFSSLFSFAQPPQAINYQGVARDSIGHPLINQNIGIKLSILDSSAVGQSVYVETHIVSTSSSGLFNLSIGLGTVVLGNFSDIKWAQGNKWFKVEIDPQVGSNYQLIGTSQFLSVPFALHLGTANTATSVSTKQESFTNYQVFSTTGVSSWMVPDGVTKVMVECWGAGGGTSTGACAGAGGYGKSIFTVVSATSYLITVGAGGNASGSNGGDSSFGNLIISYGGQGANGGYNIGGGSTGQILSITGQSMLTNSTANCCAAAYGGFGNGGEPGGGGCNNGTAGYSKPTGGNGRIIIWW